MKAAQVITRAIDFFYLKPLHKVVPVEVFRYAVCGGVNLVFGWVLYWFLYRFIVPERLMDLGFMVITPHTLTLFIQFAITFFTGFWLNRYITFTQSTIRGGAQMFRYLLQVGGALLIQFLVLKLLVEVIHIYPTIANVLASLITVVYSFLTAKFFTFRTSSRKQ